MEIDMSLAKLAKTDVLSEEWVKYPHVLSLWLENFLAFIWNIHGNPSLPSIGMDKMPPQPL